MNKLLIMRTHLLWIGVMTASSLWLSGCTQEEKYPFFPEKGYDSGTVIPIKISMAENGEYDSYTPENDMAPRYNAPLIAEWAGVQTLSRTRTKESPEYNGPRIASMELTENTPSTLTTRANTLSTGVYFRLIVFRKSGNNYVFQSAADYTSNGASSPVLKKGKLLTRSGTIRVIGYSFNTTAALGDIPASYTYNTTNTASFNPNTNQTTTIRMVPFASSRTITVHFNKLTVGNLIANNADNIDIASTQSVQLKEGMSYTMKIQFKRSPGINVPAGSINLSNPKKACTNDDKQKLSKLVFADGNLKSTGASNNYVWATNKEYGYYYQWKKDYNGNNIDPCARLNPTTYGSGWRLPTRNELERLGRCNNVKKVSNGVNGLWFLNATTGIFLPLGGWRNNNSGTTAEDWPGTYGQYFTDESINTNDCYRLDISPGEGKTDVNSTPKKMAYTTRCVKGPKL